MKKLILLLLFTSVAFIGILALSGCTKKESGESSEGNEKKVRQEVLGLLNDIDASKPYRSKSYNKNPIEEIEGEFTESRSMTEFQPPDTYRTVYYSENTEDIDESDERNMEEILILSEKKEFTRSHKPTSGYDWQYREGYEIQEFNFLELYSKSFIERFSNEQATVSDLGEEKVDDIFCQKYEVADDLGKVILHFEADSKKLKKHHVYQSEEESIDEMIYEYNDINIIIPQPESYRELQ